MYPQTNEGSSHIRTSALDNIVYPRAKLARLKLSLWKFQRGNLTEDQKARYVARFDPRLRPIVVTYLHIVRTAWERNCKNDGTDNIFPIDSPTQIRSIPIARISPSRFNLDNPMYPRSVLHLSRDIQSTLFFS